MTSVLAFPRELRAVRGVRPEDIAIGKVWVRGGRRGPCGASRSSSRSSNRQTSRSLRRSSSAARGIWFGLNHDTVKPAIFRNSSAFPPCRNVSPLCRSIPVRIVTKTTAAGLNGGRGRNTWQEVANLRGGFVPPANPPGESVVAECAGGFGNVKVAKTRILQGSHLNITGLSKGTHLFQCCIHPWMHFQVTVK